MMSTQILRLYAADYMPDHLESNSLKSNISEHDKLLEQVTSRIFDLERQLHELYLQRDELLDCSTVQKALIAPIRKLAPEILGYVFQLACEGEVVASAEQRRTITPSTMQFQLSQVCKKWRRVAVGTPHLWTNIALDRYLDPSLNVNPFIVITEWVRRSGALPLDVYFGDGLEKTFNFPKCASSFRVSMKMLGRHFDRVRSFHVGNGFTQVLPTLFPLGQRKKASSLVDFRVLPKPTNQLINLGQIDAPILQNIDVYRPSTFFDSLVLDYSHLRSLRWNTPPRTGPVDREATSLQRLAEVLELSSNLSSCEIIYPSHAIIPLNLSKEFIIVPSLTHLTLKFTLQSDPSPLLAILRAPALQSLTLEQTAPIANVPGFIGAVSSFLTGSTAPLKSLHLHRLILTAEDIPLISSLSRVESLYFKQSFIHDAFMEALRPIRGTHPDAWPVPMLGAVAFEASMFAAEVLREVAEARLEKPGMGLEAEEEMMDIDPDYRPRFVCLRLVKCRFGGEDGSGLGRIQGVVVDVVNDD